MTRYTLGTLHKDGIGQPAIVVSEQGEYVLLADHLRILAACESHNELLMARLKRAEGKE